MIPYTLPPQVKLGQYTTHMGQQIMLFGLIICGITKKMQKKHTGFTLIELLLYVAIFSILISTVMFIAFSSVAQRAHNQAVAEVDYQGEIAMNQITQQIRNASTINAPTPGNTLTSLSINTPTSSNNPTIYDLYNDGSRYRLRIREGSAGTSNYLTNNKVTLSNLSFRNVAVTGGRDSIKVQFTISSYNPSNLGEIQYTKTFYGTGTLR